MVYRWKELQLFTIQTLSNIITFIQFALAPLELIGPDSKTNNEELILKINEKFSSIIKFFESPLNFIKKYNEIIGPVRTMLSALLLNAVIIFLYTIFFLPSWRFFVLFLDIFIPGCFLFGIVFMSKKYDEQIKISIILLIVGIVYFLFRITLFILHILKNERKKWYVKCANGISSVFLSRIKKNNDFQDEVTEDIQYQIEKNTIFIQFDEFHFTYKKRIIDFLITFFIWLVLLFFVIFGWKKILSKSYKGSQLEDISLISDMITYLLFFGMCIRFLINVIWLIKPIEKKIFKIFKFLNKLAYKGIIFLAGVSLIPLLGMALKSTTNILYNCGRFYYYDSKSNSDSFLKYFMKIEEPCQFCSIHSINADKTCSEVCSLNISKPKFVFEVAIDSSIYTSTFDALYIFPVLVFDAFYLSLFLYGLRLISKMALDILVILPAPTENIECKFQTLINTIDSASLNTFRSYRYKNSLYSFAFTESKLFVYFCTNFLFCGFLPIRYHLDPIILCFVVSFASFFIAQSQFFTSPYISVLHNIVNAFSYSVSGISSLLVGLHLSQIFKMPQQLAVFLVIMIVVTPIITALITPLFIKKDPLLVPTKFDLLKIQKWDKKIVQIIDFRRKKSIAKKKLKKHKINKNNDDDDDFHFNNEGVLLEDEPSISVSYFKNNMEQEPNDILISNFELKKLMPIKIQERLNRIQDNEDDIEFKQLVEKLWPRVMINNECFDKATNEMINSSNKLIDCICYTNLIRLFNVALIFSSACLGWCLSSGIERWQKILSPEGYKYYLRCNMLLNGSFPAYGTYLNIVKII